ncbi:hypothetical protein ABPG74_002093 [Tetrahymena malaccensis]
MNVMHIKSSNSIGNEEISSLGKVLQTYNDLQNLILWLRHNNITKEGLSNFAESLSNCTKIRQFTLLYSYNKFELQTVQIISQLISKFVCLQSLYLDLSQSGYFQFKFNKNDAICLSSALEKLTQLQNLKLQLSSRSFDDEKVEVLVPALKSLKNLKQLNLDLNFNQIGNRGLSSLAQSFQCANLSTIKLILSFNNFGKEGITNLCSALQQSKNLKSLALDLKYNQQRIDDEQAILLSSAITECSNLLILILSISQNNFFTNNFYQSL